MKRERILIIDDEKVLCRSLAIEFKDEGFDVQTADSGEAAIDIVTTFQPQIVLLDLRLPGMDGIQVLEIIRKHNDEVAVIMMTAYGDTRTTVEAIKRGAFNFINKPFELEDVKQLVNQAIQNLNRNREFEYLKYQQRRFYRFCDLVGESSQMQAVYGQIETLAHTDDVTILIRGESGTGKDLVASAIHFRSQRNKAPFMEINCASLPESLLESELFGYEKGAFTDAKQSKKGLFELSDGGTIFLDEIGEMPLPLQAKLLRFLEKKQFKPLGSGKDLLVDARIIAATNRDLESAIKEGLFRGDLYYRLNVVPIYMPPLRERQDDIVLLADYFIDQFCKDMGKQPKQMAPEVIAVLRHHPWEGNVRELRNVVERAVIFSKGHTIGLDLMPPEITGRQPADEDCIQVEKIWQPGRSIEAAMSQVESHIIQDALKKCGDNKTRAAQMMGISRFALNRRIDRLNGLEKDTG
ncbi:MAG: sigma-54-dependent Fis family transcriptional regulator [Desulfosarcina sp.]|nr:sigma-54-dependent Fis family transcriptional regulator [Desulfosarcina sp.]MBC2742388.1 sigma-54-dependent Fis family transcriptional regulator [Desulfosarcina sp.]MBC2765298.1 sigma-54-dependent Fis family transcriptional regulator [Desulfosarcina sp.]